MGKNLVRKIFLNDQSWTVPAGVKQVHVYAYENKISQIAAGLGTPVVITASGAAYAWGLNNSGQVGDNSRASRSNPTAVTGSLVFKQVTSGNGISAGIASDGTAYAWGNNGTGQLGNNNLSVLQASNPTAVSGGLFYRQISAGNNSVAAIDSGANGKGWGDNTYGNLGDGTTSSRSAPASVSGGRKWRFISTSGLHTVGIDNNGDAYAWGNNAFGQLGFATNINNVSSPVLVAGGIKWSQVACSAGFGGTWGNTVGIDVNGNAYAWGSNSTGQLGQNDLVARSSPVVILGGRKASSISIASGSGADVANAMLADLNGNAYAWGHNNLGQLGDGTIIDRSSPVAVIGGLKFSQISCGELENGVGIATNGVVYSWGDNSSGQNGDNTLVSRSSPVAVTGGQAFNLVRQTLINEMFLGVTPGTTYTATVFAQALGLDAYIVAQAFGQTRLVLEYEA